jgi:ATP:ADP antiporter, AAA family
MSTTVPQFLNLRRGEGLPVFLAGLYFFLVLTALMVLRPARDAIGMSGGLDAVRWLFIGTALVTLAVNPAFGWLVSRFRRLTFISLTYAFFALSLVGFYALIVMAPEAVGEISGRVFYIWFSVFNLFSTMVFWALMADRFALEQSKRLFGIVAVGGTLGAIFGPWLASQLAQPLGTPALMLVSAAFLVLAVATAWGVARVQPEVLQAGASRDVNADGIIGGNAWSGISAVLKSPYLLGVSSFVLVMTIMATFIYFTRLQMVAAAADDTDVRTTIFAQIDLITQVSTLVLQALVTGQLMRRLGVAVALAILPVVVSLGFIGLAIAGSFAALIVFDAAFRAIQRAVTRPARETLFTVVTREQKYKSKAFTDTFVYRGGDVIGAWTEGLLGRLGFALVGLASVAVPLAVVWAMLGLWLGRRQQQEAESARLSDRASAPAAGRP